MRLGVVALTVLMAPTPLIGSSVAMGVLLFLAGFAIAPTLIARGLVHRADGAREPAHRGHRDAAHHDGRRHRPGRGASPVSSSTRTAPHAAYLVPLGSGLLGVLAAIGTRGGRSIGSRSEHLDELVPSGDGPTDA